MAYVDFDLRTAVRSFGLSEDGKTDLFTHTEPVEPSDSLRDNLAELAPIALGINTEQARLQYIISPILIEAKRRSRTEINVVPGIMFEVDETKGLTGYCDYLIARSSGIYCLESPVVAVVGAKREDLVASLGQCAAEMVAIRLFNEKDGRPTPIVHGAVTSGSNWRFLRLQGKDLFIDVKEYFLDDLARILGILVRISRG